MKKSNRIAPAAVIGATLLGASPIVAACTIQNAARPFTAGPMTTVNVGGENIQTFPQYVVDSNGVALAVCADSYASNGNPAPCFYDPVEPGVALSEALGRGGEAFMFLADSLFTTPGSAPLDAVFVLGVETAFLSPQVTNGFQTQFQRFRTRLNVSQVGIYTVESPWGMQTYRVTSLLPAGNGQNRSEVSDPIDIAFSANSSVAGLVSPFLIAKNKPALRPEDQDKYIGDGVTLTEVTGSPCGTNFIRITAVGLDGVTPIPINTRINPENEPINVYTNRLFTVQGKLAPDAAPPLAVTAAYYSRTAGMDTVTVMAEGTTRPDQHAAVRDTSGNLLATLQSQTNRYYGRFGLDAAAGKSVTVTTSFGPATAVTTVNATITDLVTIDRAEAVCTTVEGNKTCNLTVAATSSDDGSAEGVAPTLTLEYPTLSFASGDQVTAPLPVSNAMPAEVTVTSVKGGVARKSITVVNQ